MRLNPFLVLIFSTLANLCTTSVDAQVYINELCPKNDTIIADEDGEFVDWIELYNPGPASYSLSGHHLSSDPDNLTEWPCPAVVIDPGEFVLVFASGKDRTSPNLHTNFRLSQSGETIQLLDANGLVVDAVTHGIVRNNHTYGHSPDASNTDFYFTVATPGASNTETGFNGYAPTPVSSLIAGFYDEPQNVFLSTGQAGINVYMTRDGSPPTQNDELFTSTFQVDTSVVIRAQAFGDSLIPSLIQTNTYFFGDTSRIPVMSISTHPANLWSDSAGIYITGPNADTIWPFFGANYWNDWEIPIHIEYFDENKLLVLEQDLGMEIHGWVQSRTQPMKSLEVIARSRYGSAVIDYPIFKENPVRPVKRFVLRNSGGDFNRLHFRDGLLHNAMIHDDLHLDMLAYHPVQVYLNGQYWGLHNLREKSGAEFVKENYLNVNADNLDLLENDTMVTEGDFDAFNSMYTDVMSRDMQDKRDYEAALAYWDWQNMVDYYAAETYWNNFDWPYWNVKFWRERVQDAKWRYFLVDLDVSLNNEGWASIVHDNLGRIMRDDLPYNRHLDLLKKFLENDTFRKYFINRYADLINTTYSRANMTRELHTMADAIRPELPRHFERWGGTVEWWDFNHLGRKTQGYINDKPDSARHQLQRAFDLGEQVSLTFRVYPPEAGKIQVHTVTPDTFPWNGIYFDGTPVSFQIKPLPGFQFKYWQSINTIIDPDYNLQTEYNFSSNDTIVAYFETNYTGLDVALYPNPTTVGATGSHFTIEFELDTVDAIAVELFDLCGTMVQRWSPTRYTGGVHRHTLPLLQHPTGIYLVRMHTSEATETRKLVIVQQSD